MNYKFHPNIWMTLATLVMLALCIKLGMWQYDKADTRRSLQTQLNTRLSESAVALPNKVADLENWRYKRVKFTGQYDIRYQLMLDNQVQNTVAGYHVLTPMKVEGSDIYVLVNRGWIARAAAQVGELPKPPTFDTPAGVLEIEGDIGLPTNKFFTLEAPPAKDGAWQRVWQHLDMQRYAQTVPFKMQPFIVRLDPKSHAGGFVRSWPPPGERVTMHLGYAYQWFGFALTLLVIFIVLNIKKVER